MIAGELAQQILIGGIDGDLRAAGQNLGGGAINVLALHQHGHGLAPSVQCPVDDLGAFGNEHSLGRLKAVQQLGLCQPGIHIQLGGGKISDFNYVGHKHIP